MRSLAEKLASGIARLLPEGKQSDDLLVNIKATTRWIENLPVGNAYKCQQALSTELKRFNETTPAPSTDQLAIFMLLDERARELQDTLVRQYLRNPRMSRPVESQLWHMIYGLYWEVARGYHAFVLHIAPESGKKQFDDLVQLFTLRAIGAFGQLLKWRAIRYLPASEKIWLRLHNLYRISETGGFHRRLLRAYPGEEIERSCESDYLHILMLNLANSGTLYPKQLDLLDHWLILWRGQFQLDAQPDPDTHTFSVDLSADQGPRRVRKPDPSKPMRFWSTARLLSVMHALHNALRKGSTPLHLGLGESTRPAEAVELLGYLLLQWAPLKEREQRRAPRAGIKRLVDVVHGFGTIVGQFQAEAAQAYLSPYGTGLNYREENDIRMYGFVTTRTADYVAPRAPPVATRSSNVERWVMYDESECGYGAVVELHGKDWLRVGALIGIKPHESEQWQIGIVRRLARISTDTSSVGIETLATIPMLVSLHDFATPHRPAKQADDNPSGLLNACLLLMDSEGSYSLILDPVLYLSGKVCRISGIPKFKLVSLGSPIERSEGWIRTTVTLAND